MNKKLHEIQEDIRTLRDEHDCPNDTDDSLECTCHGYDAVIDNIGEIIEELRRSDCIKLQPCRECGSTMVHTHE